MRKVLWMVSLVLLCMALGSLTARADSLITNADGYVTGINGLVIDGTTYNVTFGDTPDTTFYSTACSPAYPNCNEDARVALDTALGSTPIIDAQGLYNGIAYSLQYAYVSEDYAVPPNFSTITNWDAFCSGAADTCMSYYANLPATSPYFFWADFTPSAATPETATSTFMLTSLALMGLVVVLRKRTA
jgi:hypothetical protein